MRIEICGTIGVGKSTLANLLVNKGFNVVLENFNLNPFWEAFYTNPGLFAFESEITFLLQHYHDIKKIEKKNLPTACDFSFIQDMAYARMGLSGKRLDIFEDIYNEIIDEIHLSKLLIHITCQLDISHKRIMERGRIGELLITKDFLQNLSDHIEKEVNALSSTIEILTIDTSNYDYVNDHDKQKDILNRIVSSYGI